ncbi:hypothetical protein CGRA01v4_05433 [Colletotrichum graminicola]|nr:hypothetical protein CGRA01v4_05433 [Colletotrichum graminicola]
MIMEPKPPVTLAACHPAPMLAESILRNELGLADKQTTGRVIWPRSQFPDRYLGENEPECFEETSGSFPGGPTMISGGGGGGGGGGAQLLSASWPAFSYGKLTQKRVVLLCIRTPYIKEVRDADLLAQHNRAGISRMHAAGPRSSTDASLSIDLANIARLPPPPAGETNNVKHVAHHPPLPKRLGLGAPIVRTVSVRLTRKLCFSRRVCNDA